MTSEIPIAGTIGNRIEARDGVTAVSGTPNYSANNLNQYSSVGAFSPTHDADGNQIDAQVLPLGSSSLESCDFSWDAENRLISAIVNGTSTTYLYDAQSRRIAKTVGTGGSAGPMTTLYLYDGWNCIAEYSTSDLQTFDLRRSYTWGMDLSGSMQGAGGVGGLLAAADHSGSYYPTYDGNGNVSEYLDANGTPVAHYEYDPFGRTIIATYSKAGDFVHRFSTKPLDGETGLYYYAYRYYDPVTGRWPSRDPIKEIGGVNLYGFVRNRGINKIDVKGRMEYPPNDYRDVTEEQKRDEKNRREAQEESRKEREQSEASRRQRRENSKCCDDDKIAEGKKKLDERYARVKKICPIPKGGLYFLENEGASCHELASAINTALKPSPSCWECEMKHGRKWYGPDHWWVECVSFKEDGSDGEVVVYDAYLDLLPGGTGGANNRNVYRFNMPLTDEEWSNDPPSYQ